MSNLAYGAMIRWDDLYPGMVVRVKHQGITRVDTVAGFSHDAELGTVDIVFQSDVSKPINNLPDTLEYELIHYPDYVYDYYQSKVSNTHK